MTTTQLTETGHKEGYNRALAIKKDISLDKELSGSVTFKCGVCSKKVVVVQLVSSIKVTKEQNIEDSNTVSGNFS